MPISSTTLDVAIGLALVFLTLSVVVSAINETLATILGLRASDLQKAMSGLLGPGLAQDVMNHPTVPAAQSGDAKRPSYIEPAYFAIALLDTLVAKGNAPAVVDDANGAQRVLTPFQRVQVALGGGVLQPQIEDAAFKAVSAFAQHSDSDYPTLQAQIAGWFDAYMDRVGGVYKRRSQVFALLISLVVVGILDVDAVKIYKQLTSQPAYAAALAARTQAVVATAQANAGAGGPGSAPLDKQIAQINGDIAAIPVALGWHAEDKVDFTKLVGLLIAIIAGALGAPFWFDALGKLSNLRGSGAKPDPTPPPATSKGT
ncbi:MAG TPA: hypothetical protein VHT05_10655 [Candidatus Elarobacter sp.]|nr:hypothetical protein [Candidatus Elarobacter sp.]